MAVEGGGGGGTLSELYHSSRRLLLKTRECLEHLERLEFSSSSNTVDASELAVVVRRDISHIQTLCSDMDGLWQSVASKSQRDLWKRFASYPRVYRYKLLHYISIYFEFVARNCLI